MQQHRSDSLFQNTQTFKTWVERFIEIVKEDRVKYGLPDDQPAIM